MSPKSTGHCLCQEALLVHCIERDNEQMRMTRSETNDEETGMKKAQGETKKEGREHW